MRADHSSMIFASWTTFLKRPHYHSNSPPRRAIFECRFMRILITEIEFYSIIFLQFIDKSPPCLSKTPSARTGTAPPIQKHQYQRDPHLRAHRQRERAGQELDGTPLPIQLHEVEQWRQKKGALHVMPKDFDPSRYASFSVREVVEEPVNGEHIHEYAERSRLSRRLGF